MKILYGVQATGNGHISRSREVINRLKALGHAVQVVLSGRDPSLLWDMEAFQPFTALKGLTFFTSRGRVQYVETARHLDLIRFYRDIREFDAAGFDVVVTDFEPVSSRVARRNRIPSIGIGHQYAFVHDIPVAGANPIASFVIKNYAPVDFPLGLHWHHFNYPILPPIIPRLDPPETPSLESKILVYLPFENLEDVLAICEPLSTYDFFIYLNRNGPEDRGHIHLRAYSREGFLRDLKTCTAVVTNAGFELASEALHLGKKIVVKPLAGQMEQLSNAAALSQLKLGEVVDKLTAEAVEAKLRNMAPAAVHYPDVAGMVAAWIDRGRWEETRGLCRQAWAQTKLSAGAASGR